MEKLPLLLAMSRMLVVPAPKAGEPASIKAKPNARRIDFIPALLQIQLVLLTTTH